MSHMSTVDSHSDKRLKGHDTTNSRNLTNISFFEMEKIKIYFGSLTKGSAYENARFLEYVLKNTEEYVCFLAKNAFFEAYLCE